MSLGQTCSKKQKMDENLPLVYTQSGANMQNIVSVCISILFILFLSAANAFMNKNLALFSMMAVFLLEYKITAKK
jgi:hypothetical protein